MKAWSGTPSPSSVRAIRYRERRANRALYIGAMILMGLPWAWELITTALSPWNSYTVMYLKDIILMFTGNQPNPLYYDIIVAGLLGIGLVWNDRGRGFLDHVLEGPVTRRQIFLTKVLFGICTIVAAFLGILIAMGITLISIHKLGLIDAVLERSILATAAGVLVFMIVMSLTSAIGSVVFTAIAAGLASMVPQLTAALYVLAVGGWTHPITSSQQNVYVLIQQFSPLPPNYPLGPFQLIFTAVFAVLSLLLGSLGLRWWSRVAQERFHEPFLFPWLWNLFYASLAIVSGGILDGVANASLRYSQVSVWIFPAVWAGLAFILWFVWRRIVLWVGKTALRWGPGAEF